MSPSIWTQCAGKSKLSSLSLTAWRICEDQYRNVTRKLVGSDAEQIRLELALEGAKPPLPGGPEWENLHYLLITPFRYASPYGSRLRSGLDPGVWYGSAALDTAVAETAFQRLRFLNDTEAALEMDVTLTGFSARLRSKSAIDLTAPPFHAFENKISSPITYRDSQPLSSDMRKDNVEFCQYRSAREVQGLNVAVFHPDAFAQRTVPDSSRETITCFGNRDAVGLRWLRFSGEKLFHFDRSRFEVEGVLPLMRE